MRPNTLMQTLKALIVSGKNVMIEGPPGLGKTAMVKQAGAELGEKYVIVFKHGPTMQPEDLALPFRGDNGRLDFGRANWIPLQGDYADDTHVVIVIDEMPQGSNDIQKTIANLMQERECYGIPLHQNVSFICTGNRAKDRAGANRILSHLRNRMVTITLEPHLDDWCKWALANGIRPEIVGFVRFKPGALNDFDANRDINPTPRAWAEGVNDICAMVEAGTLPAEAEIECYNGYVGEGAASEFVSFVRMYRSLPDPDVVLKNPSTHPLPAEASVRYALSGALAARATEKNFDAVVEFAVRLPAEFTVHCVLDSIRRLPALQRTKAFTDWVLKHGANVLI